MSRTVTDRSNNEWPVIVPLISGALMLTTMAFAIYQRHAHYLIQTSGHVRFGHVPVPLSVLFGAIAIAPFVLDCVEVFGGPKLALPLWLFPVPVLVGIGFFVLHPAQIDFAPFILVFTAAELASRSSGRVWIGVAAMLESVALMVGVQVAGVFQGALIWVAGIVFGWLGGFLIEILGRTSQELRDAQDDLAQKAAADERSRIAREVHDVIAHSMSVTMLHLTAARMALEAGKPDDALDALQEAERQGRSSMTDIRRTVGLLGSESETVVPPMPSAADLPKLVTDFRTAGVGVALNISGDFRGIDPAAGLSIYRIVQESLTNVAKHAPGAEADIDLSITDHDIRLRVCNARTNGASDSSDGNGMGLRGMIERAAVLNGRLVAGPSDEGWIVELIAPR